MSSHAGGLEVTADGLDMRTRVACGGCVVEGYVYVLEDDGGEPFALTHDAQRHGGPHRPRGGAAGKRPVRAAHGPAAAHGHALGQSPAPALTRNAQVWELALAQVRVRASATTIAPEDVTDERGDEAACGYAVAALAGPGGGRAHPQQPDRHRAGLCAGRAAGQGPRRKDRAAATTATYSATLTADGWSASAPYTQTAAAAGVLSTDDPFVDVDMSGASGSAQGTALTEAWGFVGRVTAGSGQINGILL